MEKTYCPLLANMTREDLSQRYANTFVEYDGEILFIRSFILGAEGLYFESHNGDNNRGYVTSHFDWKKLNTWRPPAGWYVVNVRDVRYPVYVYYTTQKQYSRGHSERTTVCFWPGPQYPLKSLRNVVKEMYNPVFSVPVERINAFPALGPVVPRRQIMFNGDTGLIYYRTLPIGFWGVDNKVYVIDKMWMPEIQEVCTWNVEWTEECPEDIREILHIDFVNPDLAARLKRALNANIPGIEVALNRMQEDDFVDVVVHFDDIEPPEPEDLEREI